jgi:PAS domain S-box-containing protein
MVLVQDVDIAKKISEWLYHSDYQVRTVINPKEIDYQYQGEKPDLILMDIFLKFDENIEKALSKIQNPSTIPTLFLAPDIQEINWIADGQNSTVLKTPLREDLLKIAIENSVYRIKMDKMLLESKLRYDLLIESAEDPIAVISYEGEFLYVNKMASNFFGVDPEDIIGTKIWDIFPPHYAASQMRNIKSVIETGQGMVIVEQTSIEGENYWFSSNIQPMPLIEGINPSAQLIARNITNIKEIEGKLKSEKTKLRTITENAPFGLVLIDKNGDYIYMNPHFRDMCGYDLHEVPNGKTWFNKVFPDPNYRKKAIDAWISDFKNAQPGERKPRVFKVRCKNGDEKIFDFIPVILENGQYLMTVNDITSQRKVEKALKQSEEKFRTLAQTAVDAIIITDADNNIVFSNRSLERIFDHNHSDILGLPINMLIPDEYQSEFQGQMDIPIENEEYMGIVFETYGLRKDGSEFPLEISLNHWEVEGESYTTAIIRDITRRRLYEFKLKMREEIFQLMANNINEVFWIIDPLNGQLIYMSPSYKFIWGENTDLLFQNPRAWIQSIVEEDRERFIEHIFGNKSSKWHESLEFRLLRPDGEIRWILTRAFPVINENKEIYRRVGIATDITKLKEIEEDLEDCY